MLRELSIALCRGTAFLPRSGAVVLACFAPCVWIWFFWFGFALRRVALLCDVYVRLHLVLLPAGGPFLPSLSVNL
jgi:hypothetical protein